jgi:hypothetical protein
VDDNFIVDLPRIKSRRRTFGDEAIAFDAATARIISSEDEFSSEVVITEP